MQGEDMMDYLDASSHPDDVKTDSVAQQEKLSQAKQQVNQFFDESDNNVAKKPKNNSNLAADFIQKQRNQADVVYKEHGLSMLEIDPREMPAGRYYHKGTRIYVKPPTLREIIQFSHVNPNSAWDIRNKIDLLLEKCVIVTDSNNQMLGHYFLKEADRVYLILLLRELTFPEGQYYTNQCTCSSCGNKTQIPLTRQYITINDPDQLLEEFYNPDKGAYVIFDKTGEEWELGLPTIGLQTQMNQRWLALGDEDQKDPLVKEFYRIMPYIIYDRALVDDNTVSQLMLLFEELSPVNFAFIKDITDRIRPGIKGLIWKCNKCGSEEETRIRFRDGLKSLFALPGGFRSYTGEPLPATEEV